MLIDSASAGGLASRVIQSREPLLIGRLSEAIKTGAVQGIATLCGQTAEAVQLIDLADATLYQAKQLGRDQVRLANPTPRARYALTTTQS